MPDQWSDADIAAAAQIASAGINYASGANQNRRQREWSEDMYNKQRADALTDWQMQNDYNSPAAQMKRLVEAGLNPNLVYGKGITQESGTVRSSTVENWSPTAPTLELQGAASALMQSQQLKLQAQHTDNLAAQKRLIEQQIIGEAARTQATGIQTDTSKFNLQQLQTKAATDIAQVEANLQQTLANTKYTLAENERKAAIQSPTLEAAIQNVQNLRKQNSFMDEQIKNAQKDGTLKDLDIRLRENGIQPGDPAYLRVIPEILNLKPGESISDRAKEILRNINNKLPDWLKVKRQKR